MTLVDIFNRFSNLYYRLITQFYYRPQFSEIGSGSTIRKPLFISNPQHIKVGQNVFIRDGCRLELIDIKNGAPPNLRIGDNTNIEQNVHIVCHNRIDIGNNVSITGNCSLVDVTHPYQDINDPTKIGERILNDEASVIIGDGCFIGMGTVILPQTTIGKNVIIGANSVVKGEFPNYTVIAGAPARIIRKYDHESKQWITVKYD